MKILGGGGGGGVTPTSPRFGWALGPCINVYLVPDMYMISCYCGNHFYFHFNEITNIFSDYDADSFNFIQTLNVDNKYSNH